MERRTRNEFLAYTLGLKPKTQDKDKSKLQPVIVAIGESKESLEAWYNKQLKEGKRRTFVTDSPLKDYTALSAFDHDPTVGVNSVWLTKADFNAFMDNAASEKNTLPVPTVLIDFDKTPVVEAKLKAVETDKVKEEEE